MNHDLDKVSNALCEIRLDVSESWLHVENVRMQ